MSGTTPSWLPLVNRKVPARQLDVPETRAVRSRMRASSALELQAPRQRIDRAAQAEPEREVLDRIGGQRVVLQRQADDRQIAAEPDRVAQPS